MADKEQLPRAGEELVKHEVITRADLEQAQEREKATGTPWYQQLIQMRKVSFQAVEGVLRYEMHPRALREEHQTLGDHLMKMGALTKDQLKQALAEQKRTGRLLGKILLEQQFVTPAQCAQALARQHELEYADHAATPSSQDALEAMPENLARKHGMLPVDLSGDRITVLITDPQVRDRIGDAALLLGKRIHPVITACDDLKAEITRRYAGEGKAAASASPPPKAAPAPKAKEPAQASASPTIEAPEKGKKKKEAPVAEDVKPASAKPDAETARFDEIQKQAQGASVIRMVSTIIEGAVNSSASASACRRRLTRPMRPS